MRLDNRVIVPVLLKDNPIVFCVECSADRSTLSPGDTADLCAPGPPPSAGRWPQPPGSASLHAAFYFPHSFF